MDSSTPPPGGSSGRSGTGPYGPDAQGSFGSQYPGAQSPQGPGDQPYASQPDPSQPYEPQPYPGQPAQPYPGQTQLGQPYSSQPLHGQPSPGQPFQGQPFQGQAYPGQAYPGQAYPGQAQPGQPYQGERFPVQQSGGYPGGQYPPVPPGPLTHLGDGAPLASVWKRLGAALLDSLFVGLCALPLYLIVGIIWAGVFAGTASLASNSENGSPLTGGVGIGVMLLMWLVILVGMIAISYFYYVARVRKVGATFGKQLLGLRIRSVRAEGQLTYGQILARWLAVSFVSSLTGGLLGILDALWCLWDPLRQCLHDKVAGTVVTDDQLEWLPPSHPEVLRARATPPAKGWLADGPVPHTPPGYPRHPGAGTYLGA